MGQKSVFKQFTPHSEVQQVVAKGLPSLIYFLLWGFGGAHVWFDEDGLKVGDSKLLATVKVGEVGYHVHAANPDEW
eukprot:12801-Amphidinium_carterae.1